MIFNSLGSNYNLSYVLKSLSTGNSNDNEKLKNLLEKKYNGKAMLFYKGRQALTASLQILKLPQDSRIVINGFTCVAVFNAIRKAEYEPLCLDLEKNGGLNFSAKTLEGVILKNKKVKVVVVQNTLGYPCDIEKIVQICRKNKLILIEDLAHSVGTTYSNGREAGTVGDFVVLSFSQDKIIDAVSGGALVIRNTKYKMPSGTIERHPEGVLKDRIYPLETYKIRLLYKFGLGKPYHFVLGKFNLLTNIMDESFYDYYSLPNWHAALALYQFKSLEKQLSHRKKIARIYFSTLPKSLLIYDTQDIYDRSSNLRFPIIIEDRQKLLNLLKKNGIYLFDIWYTDVAPECNDAQDISNRILNLPTHINVTEKDAGRICRIINDFLSMRAK